MWFYLIKYCGRWRSVCRKTLDNRTRWSAWHCVRLLCQAMRPQLTCTHRRCVLYYMIDGVSVHFVCANSICYAKNSTLNISNTPTEQTQKPIWSTSEWVIFHVYIYIYILLPSGRTDLTVHWTVFKCLLECNTSARERVTQTNTNI